MLKKQLIKIIDFNMFLVPCFKPQQYVVEALDMFLIIFEIALQSKQNIILFKLGYIYFLKLKHKLYRCKVQS